jgi:hypothetical protein
LAVQLLGNLVELRPYARAMGVGFGAMLILVATLFNHTGLMLVGGVIAVFSAFWPSKKAASGGE